MTFGADGVEEIVQSKQEWLEALDALIAAPKHHKLLFENDSVRVLDTSIAPGETTPLHTHRCPATLYVLNWSNFMRRDGNGTVIFDSRTTPAIKPGSAFWSPPMAPHTLENVGTAELHVIAVELKTEPLPAFH
jgi:quercetin dioxygenase-like cupin family protein